LRYIPIKEGIDINDRSKSLTVPVPNAKDVVICDPAPDKCPKKRQPYTITRKCWELGEPNKKLSKKQHNEMENLMSPGTFDGTKRIFKISPVMPKEIATIINIV